MDEVRVRNQQDQLMIELSGRVDSGNAAEVEKEITELTRDYRGSRLVIDMQDLNYISSSGLRILLRMLKKHRKLRIINASSEIYEILEMTGFTEMMDVEKAYRQISVEGCELIGSGANGKVYRFSDELVVKVYKDANALEDIQRERELARLALVLGIPTAISYDVVRVGNTYGSVFELLDAHSFSKILAEQPEKMDWCVKEYVDLLKLIHSTRVPDGKLPSMKQVALDWAKFVREYLPEEEGNKLVRLVEEVPENPHMIHGDYHTKNLEMTGEEVLLIDMDTLAVGHPVFEFASMYNAFVGFGEYDNSVTEKFMGFERERAGEFWHRSLKAYLGTNDEERVREVENKARIIGYTRLIRRSIRRGGLEDPERLAEIELWKQRLTELLHTVDSLLF
ncbi:MAG: anti-sigma factor antagonist, partial [Firmicutes bacterium]|nr:anti-sigma factor antagonist [Bacillota bacterium]